MFHCRPDLQTACLLAILFTATYGCDGNGRNDDVLETATKACDSEPEVRTTGDGVEFVRSPDSCFESLSDWPYEPEYVELDGLRQAYVDEGEANGQVVLLLHGQPSWSYLYRKMIPVLTEAGYRVIAMDHLGMGRSDKPTHIENYSYLDHSERLLRFIDALGLDDVTLFGQDWGGILGLRVAGMNPDRFARIAIGNSTLHDTPAGEQLYPPVENPNEIETLESRFENIPARQPLFYLGCQRRFPYVNNFANWMIYAMKAESFRPSEVLEAATYFDLPDADEAAYDAPFPSRIYMAGVRTFPSLINEVAGQNAEAWSGLSTFDRPFVTLWGANDPGNLGDCDRQDLLICAVEGADGQPHARIPQASHFLQDDQGAEIARRLVAFIQNDPSVAGSYEASCEGNGLSKAGLRSEITSNEKPGMPSVSHRDEAERLCIGPRAVDPRTNRRDANQSNPICLNEHAAMAPNHRRPATDDVQAALARSKIRDPGSFPLAPAAADRVLKSPPPAVPSMGTGAGLALAGMLVGLAYRGLLRRS